MLDLSSGLRAGTQFQPLLLMTSSREGHTGGGWAAGACSEKPAGPGRAIIVAGRPAEVPGRTRAEDRPRGQVQRKHLGRRRRTAERRCPGNRTALRTAS